MTLTYDQRKALRRIGRGQSIPERMQLDEVIAKCFTWSVPIEPPKPVREMNVIEYCDWEAAVLSAYPVLTDYGRKLLNELEDQS